MEIMKLSLEYIKVLIWPFVLILAFSLYGNQLFTIIENREINAFGVSIGKQVNNQIDEINKNSQNQINAVKDLIKQGGSTTDIISRIEGFQNNLTKQISNVKESTNLNTLSEKEIDNLEKAKLLEKNAFEALANREINSAVKLFNDAAQFWPEYNNVKEISDLISKNKDLRKGEQSKTAWQETFRTILTSYSWGMPTEARDKLQEFLK